MKKLPFLARIIALTIAITLVTGVGVASYGAYKADAASVNYLKVGGIKKIFESIFKGGWWGKAKESSQKVGEKTKNLYKWGKRGAIGVAAFDILFNDANFIGQTLSWTFERMVAMLQLVIPPPEQLIFNYKTVVDEAGNETIVFVFKDKSEYAFYIFPDDMWKIMKGLYYFMAGIYWTTLIGVVAYNLNHLLFPTGTLNRVTAMNIISTAVITAAAVYFMPLLLSFITDISMLFVAIAANLGEPELITEGLINYEMADKLTEAFFKLITLAQMGMLYFIYFMRMIALMILFVAFPLIAVLQNFPSKRHLFSVWFREVAANVAIQPLHAFLFVFAFLYMKEAGELEKMLTSAVLLLALLPSGWMLRELLQTPNMSQSGANWIQRMIMGGSGVGGLIAAGRIMKHAGFGIKESMLGSGKAHGGVSGSGTSTWGQKLRTGLNMGAGAFGAMAGFVFGGVRGAAQGGILAAGVSNLATRSIGGLASSANLRQAGHKIASVLPFFNQDYHRQRVNTYKQLQEMPHQIAAIQQREAEQSRRLQMLDSHLTPVVAAKKNLQTEDGRVAVLRRNLTEEQQARAHNIAIKHAASYERVRPSLLKASTQYAQAKDKYEQALKDYDALPKRDVSQKAYARERMVSAYKEMQAAKSQLNQVYADPGLRAMVADGYRYQEIGQYTDAVYGQEVARQELVHAENQYGSYYEMAPQYEKMSKEYYQTQRELAAKQMIGMQMENIIGMKVETPPPNRNVTIKHYRLEPSFTPATQKIGEKA